MNRQSRFFPEGNRSRSKASNREGFTLIELLVVIAIIAILASMILPVLSKAKAKTMITRCMNNNRQMMLGWNMYATDHNELLLASLQNNSSITRGREVWVQGNFDTDDPAQMTDPSYFIDKSPLMPYIGKSREVWKCPADPVRVQVGGQKLQRVRCNSMSQVFDFGSWLVGEPSGGNYLCYRLLSNIRKPSQTWVLGEEHPDSINDAAMAVQMCGLPGDPAPKIIDYPASFHAGAGEFAMADGHCVVRKWLGGTIKPKVTGNKLPLGNNTPTPDAGTVKDLQWWSSVTTVHKTLQR